MLREAEAKAAAKREMKEKNTTASKHRPSSDDLKKLDGSVKKNSGFVKKLVSGKHVRQQKYRKLCNINFFQSPYFLAVLRLVIESCP